GVRFSLEEKEIIDKLINKEKISYNKFIRRAVFYKSKKNSLVEDQSDHYNLKTMPHF
ncbi:hypothetical protein LCGC14_2332320, partial [marine sediment metagenome]